MPIKTFAELMEVENPTFKTLSAILKIYAESGRGIVGGEVVAIIRRMELTPGQKNDLANHARFGKWKQAALRFPEEAQEYERVVAALV